MMSLQAVESLLNEFYHSSTPNPRKKILENDLILFKNESQAWQQSLCYLDQLHGNQYLWFFMSSCLEHAITRKWGQLQQIQRSQIRDFLWSIYVKLPLTTPSRQRDTIAQLIALMGKREFPEDHPVYITHILELCRNNLQLGVVLLRVTSEEVVSEKQDVSTERKKHFQNCASMCMPEIFELLSKFIAIAVCHINGTDVNLIPANLRDYALHSSLPNDSHMIQTITEFLTCLQHLFSWIPLENVLNENFLLSIFELSRWREHNQEVSIAGMSAVTELFYVQKNVPCGKFIIAAIKGLLDQSNIGHANEKYEEKFTELLRVFTAKYAKRLVHDEIFPNFICHLYQFTFNGTGALAFTEKLGVWTPLIKEICSNQNNVSSYNEVFHSLVGGTLRKYQYQFDQDQELDMLDNETLDFNMETEWQHFLNQCIEVITVMGEGLPHQVFNQVYGEWQRTFESFLSFENAIDTKSFDMQIYDQNKCHFIHCVLRDLTSLCQTLVSLAGTLESSKSDGCFENLLQLTQCLLYFVKFFMQRRECMQTRHTSLRQYFVEMFPQILQALRGLLSLSVFHKPEHELRELIDQVGQLLLPSTAMEQQIVCLSSAQFLLSVTSVIRPKYMLEVPSIVRLVQSGSNLEHLPAPVQSVTYEMIINCFVLPWQNVPNQEQEFDKRGLVLNEYVNNLGHDLFTVEPSKIQAIQPTSILPIFKDILEYFKDNSTSVKNMIANAFKPIITKTLTIFNSCECQEADVLIAEFSLSVLKTLQLQLGIAFVKEMLTILINWATSQKLSRNRMSAIEKILQMLHLVVEQPGNSTNTLIPSILNMSLNHIQPLLTGDEKEMFANTDVAVLLYTLFDGVLYHRWQYFYKSQIHRTIGQTESNGDDQPQNAEELLSILTSYGRVLVQGDDPQIKRIILISLQRLHERWKLFNRAFFQVNLLMSFQCAFINALLAPEGALHYDLLMSILFTMGQINLEKFHQSFISSGYFGGEEKLLEDICLSTDLPTFTQRMDRLIQNTRCVRLSETR